MAAPAATRQPRHTGTQIVVRATREELAAIHAAARERGTTLSDLVRTGLIAQGANITR